MELPLLYISALSFPVFASVCIALLIWDRTKTREWLKEMSDQAYKPLVTTIDYIIHRDGEQAAKAAAARANNDFNVQLLQEELRKVQSASVGQTPTQVPSSEKITLEDGRVLELVTPDML